MRRVEIVISRGLQRIDSLHVTARLFADNTSMVAKSITRTVRMPGPVDVDEASMVSLFAACVAEMQRWQGFHPGAPPAEQDELPF